MQIKRLNKEAILPTKDLYNAGFDIAIQVENGLYTLNPNEFKTFGTGYAIWLQDPRFELQIRSRSKLGTQRGIIVTQGIGTLDSSYQGELMVSLHNISDEAFTLESGMLVAQGVISPVWLGTPKMNQMKEIEYWLKQDVALWFTEVEEFYEETERGTSGINCEDLRIEIPRL